MKSMDEILKSVKQQKEMSEWESVITSNLKNLAQALATAEDHRLMSLEHARTIWRSYLTVSGLDIPKDLKIKVLNIVDKKETK